MLLLLLLTDLKILIKTEKTSHQQHAFIALIHLLSCHNLVLPNLPDFYFAQNVDEPYDPVEIN